MKKQSNNQSTDTTLRSSSLRGTSYTDSESGQSAIRRTGFSLVELMMALGILVVGLSMVATAFPTAMLANKLSIADTSSTMISENAVAICRAKLRHGTIKGTVGGTLSDQTLLISAPAHTGDLIYPVDDTDSRYGWLLAARQIDNTNDTNDYQLVFVPYRKFLPGDAAPTFSNVVTDGNIITSGNKSIGAPVICKANGTYAFVVASDGKLSCAITPGAALTVGPAVNPDGNNSPAIGCYVVRTSMAP